MNPTSTESDRLRSSILSHLSDAVECIPLPGEDGRLGCVTPLTYPNGDGVAVWVRGRERLVEVSDYGEGFAGRHDHPPQDQKRLVDVATSISRELGVEFHGADLSLAVPLAEVGEAVWVVATASAQLSQALGILQPKRRHRAREFVGVVERTVRDRSIDVKREHRLTGDSGHVYRATLYLPKTESVVEPVEGAGNWNQATAVYAKLGDLAKSNGFHPFSLIDDREGATSGQVEALLGQVSDVVRWSTHDDWLSRVG